MSGDFTADFNALLANKIHLRDPLPAIRASYENSSPFRHVVLDNLFPADVLDNLLPEMDQMNSGQWMVVQHSGLEKIVRMRSGTDLGTAGSDLIGIVHSAAFLYLVSEITGVWQLLPDPYLQGCGYASMRPGDFFNVHSDRSVAYDTGLTRRLAMIIFLNKSWKSDYHGQLELWNSSATRCEVTIEPVFNRTVIFEVAFPNYHGVPTPLACPPDRKRQSFIVYYHTVGVDGKADVKPHSSIFAPQFYRRHSKVRATLRAITPPIVLNVARRLLRAANEPN